MHSGSEVEEVINNTFALSLSKGLPPSTPVIARVTPVQPVPSEYSGSEVEEVINNTFALSLSKDGNLGDKAASGFLIRLRQVKEAVIPA